MEIITSDTESTYQMLPSEKEALTNWFDLVVAVSEPEDVTGRIFIDNFVDDAKANRLSPNGVTTAIKQRLPLARTALTDKVIAHGEIFRSNADKGILFAVSQPGEGDFFTYIDIQLVRDNYIDPRYNGLLNLHVTPPHAENSSYHFRVNRGVHRKIPTRTGQDLITYEIPADRTVAVAKIAIDPVDIVRGGVTPRALTTEDAKTNSLRVHARLIAEIVGISPPDFLV